MVFHKSLPPNKCAEISLFDGFEGPGRPVGGIKGITLGILEHRVWHSHVPSMSPTHLGKPRVFEDALEKRWNQPSGVAFFQGTLLGGLQGTPKKDRSHLTGDEGITKSKERPPYSRASSIYLSETSKSGDRRG